MFKTIAPVLMTCFLVAPAFAADGLPQVTKAKAADQALDGQQANQFMTILISKLLNSVDFTRTTISFSAKDIKIGEGKSGRNSIESIASLKAQGNIDFTQDIIISTDEILPSLPMQAQFKDLIPKISVLLRQKQLIANVTSENADSFKISASFYEASKASQEPKIVSVPISLSNSVSSNLLSLNFSTLTIELSAPSSSEKAAALKELNMQDTSHLKVTSKVMGTCSITDSTASVKDKFDTCSFGGFYFLDTKTNQSFPGLKFKISK